MLDEGTVEGEGGDDGDDGLDGEELQVAGLGAGASALHALSGWAAQLDEVLAKMDTLTSGYQVGGHAHGPGGPKQAS